MSAQTCERCGATVEGYALLDYCVNCSKNLCAKCVAEGCCGQVPAETEGDDEEQP